MSNEIENNANNTINEKIFLLTNIFEYMPKMQNKLLPLISSSKGIKVLYSFLNYNNNCTDNIVSINEKLELLNILSKLLELNNNLIFLFLKKCKSNIKSFFDPLIDIYLNENNTAIQNKKIIEDLLLLIIKYVSTDKYIFDFIYQKLSKYFGKDEKIKLTNETFLKYLNLLDIFYTGTLGDDNNKNIIEEKKEIKNFIYFNGFKNRLSLELNKSSNNLNTDFPTLENGFSFITWIKVEKNLIDSYFLIHTNDENYFINLININLNEHNIKLQLVDSNNMILILDDIIKSNYINISSNFNYNNWNSIAFIFYSKKSSLSSVLKNSMFKLYINQHIFNIYIDLRNFISHLEKKITSIYFFENLIGKSTSILYFSFSFEEEKLFSLLNTIKEPGFYKVKYLYKFLLSNEKDYSKYSKSNIYNDNIQTKINKIIDINLKEQNIKNLMCFLCPFSYNNKANTIDDIFGNFIGVLTPENGVNSYINNFKNIENVGGIDNLLPLGELMLLSLNKNEKNLYSDKEYINYDLLDENFLNENTFLKYITIIEKIIIGYKMNLLHANKLKFFSSLELFLERLPSCIFTEQILNLFLKIGKEAFGLGDDVEENFVDMILLNEKIFSKFSEEVQQKLWDGVHDFFTSDYLQMKELIPISKICLLLRFYDKDRYAKYCCKKHAQLFDEESGDNILNPDMNIKVGKLFEIIQLFVDNLSTETETANLFKLLSLDLSPCLQKKIIIVYQKFFDNRKIDGKNKAKAIDILLSNKFFEIFEYCLSVSLFDVRIELIELLRILQNEFKNKIDEYFSKSKVLINYIGEFLLPDNLKAKLEDKNNEIIPLSKYFNKEIYKNDIALMYDVLNNWIIYKTLISKMEGKVQKLENFSEANPTAIKLFVQFVSRVSPFYIDCLLILLFSLVSNTTLNNRTTFLNNNYFYKWLLEIIFFFNNKENEKLVEESERTNIELIKSHSIELFRQFISFENQNKDKIISYFFDYSFYLKEKNKNNQNQVKEITNITRTILTIITETLSVTKETVLVIDRISKVCFEFMLLYKNSEFDINNIDENKINIIGDNTNYNSNKNKISNDLDELYENKEDIEEEKIKTNENENNMNNDKLELEKEEHNKSFDDKNDNTNNMNSIFDLILIPDILTNNIYLREQVFKNEIKNENTPSPDTNILNAMWEDFNLYNFIYDYYHDNLWGLEAMCRHVKVAYDKSLVETFGDLLKKYTDSKNKNILSKMLNRYLNYDENNIDPDKKIEKINILNLILILLCIAYDTTLDNEERTSIENQIEIFLIFCIICSINVTTSEKAHNILQNRLYDLIGYGILFFKKRDEEKYNNFLEKIVKQLFEGTKPENPKKGIKGIFAITKKTIFKNTAIDRLFILQDANSEENENSTKLKLNSSLKKGFSSSKNLNINDDEILDEKDSKEKKKDKKRKKKEKEDKKEKKDKKSKQIKTNLVFRCDSNIIVKHIINDTIKALKNERKKKLNNVLEYIKEYYYQNTKNTIINNEESKLIEEEKKRINRKILNIVPDFENNIRKYSSTSFVQEKKRRNDYQRTKKKLFSWRNFWSQKSIFYSHPEYLKLKVKNHFTKEMSKIILSPILDIDYYFPAFKKFNTEKIFNKDDIKYKINLNIENILTGIEESENENNEIKEKNNEDVILSKNKYGFNYLECLYKLNYEGLWERYKTHYEQKINLDINNNSNDNIDTINKEKEEIKNLKASFNPLAKQNETNKINKLLKKESKKNKKTNKIISVFKCCLVKSTHHLGGYISCKTKRIKFNYSLEEKRKNLTKEEILDDPSYDKDMNNCFGSTFKTSLKDKDKDKINLSIYFKNIKYIFIKKYFYQDTAMEIYTINNKSYFFNFKTNNDLNSFLQQLLKIITYREIKAEDHKGKKVLGYEQIFKSNNADKKLKSYYISNRVEDWQNFKISTLEYLMWLNIYSGRSFNDLTQYPVFPWIISNYTTQELEQETDFRNMGLPIGMNELADNEKSIMRKDTFIEIYNTVKNDLKENFHDFNYQDYLKKGEDYFYSYRNKKIKASTRNYSVQINPSDLENNEMNNLNNTTTMGDTIELLEINQLPSYFSSHYSNPTYVSHFLCRVFPFSFISIEIQGEKFDDPNRIFHSMVKTFESCMTLKDDVRELIPEFYYFPEMFKNSNNLNLTQDLLDANGEKIIINDVELPLWANKDKANFIVQMRNILENNKTKINKWIDIIFGNLQKGEKAEEIHNLFQAQSYEGMVKIDKFTNIDMRDAMMRLVEVGVTPMQIFDKESKSRLDEKKLFKNNIYSFAKGLFLDDKKCKLNKFYITSKNYKSLYNKYENYKLTDNRDYKEKVFPEIIAIKCINPKNLKIFTNKNAWYNIKITNHDNKPIFEEKNINYYQNNSSKYSPSFPISINNIPYIIYNNEKYIIKGGFWDSHLEINSLYNDNEKKEKEKESLISTTIFMPMYGPIVIMKITSDEKNIFCGTSYGNIIILEVKGSNLKINKVLYDHNDLITSISINETLNMLATSSKDGYINIYLLPSCKMIRSILISSKLDYNSNYENIEQLKKDEFLYASNIFLSSTPLPCCTIYISEKNLFKTFSINGEFIYKEEDTESKGDIKCPIIFNNLNFNDFLIYGTTDGFVKIRSFPDMKLINSIKPFEGMEVKVLELSPDKRFCYVWSNRDKIAVLKDINTSTGFEVKENNPDEHEETLMDKIVSE